MRFRMRAFEDMPPGCPRELLVSQVATLRDQARSFRIEYESVAVRRVPVPASDADVHPVVPPGLQNRSRLGRPEAYDDESGLGRLVWVAFHQEAGWLHESPHPSTARG